MSVGEQAGRHDSTSSEDSNVFGEELSELQSTSTASCLGTGIDQLRRRANELTETRVRYFDQLAALGDVISQSASAWSATASVDAAADDLLQQVQESVGRQIAKLTLDAGRRLDSEAALLARGSEVIERLNQSVHELVRDPGAHSEGLPLMPVETGAISVPLVSLSRKPSVPRAPLPTRLPELPKAAQVVLETPQRVSVL